MTGERITVRERLAPEITASLFANYRTAGDAILELVDNSVDSRLPGRPLRVDVVVRPAFIQITTVGGRGMGPREVEAHYLRWGASAKRGRNLLGRYGQGGKAAIGHLGQGFTIDASRPGDESSWQFSDTRYRDRSRLKVYELHPIPKRVDRALGYVRIRIEAVDRRVEVKRVAGRLVETYRPLLEREALTLTVNGAALHPPAIPTSERHEFRVEVAGEAVSGWYGVLAEEGPGVDPGLRCYRLGRLVGGGELFGHEGLARLVGEVEMPNVPLTTNKADFDRDSEPWIEIEDHLHRLLAPLAARLSGATAPTPARAVRVTEQARRLLGQALRMVELRGGARREPLGPIVLRPLDRGTRSRTVEEDGARLIVINPCHPLFLARRGDVWYQVETAARELLAGADGVPADEYERQVDELVLLALDLRARRRKRAPSRQPKLNLVG